MMSAWFEGNGGERMPVVTIRSLLPAVRPLRTVDNGDCSTCANAFAQIQDRHHERCAMPAQKKPYSFAFG